MHIMGRDKRPRVKVMGVNANIETRGMYAGPVPM